jgi:hypothetical protein
VDVALATATARTAGEAELRRLRSNGASAEVLRECQALLNNVLQALMLKAEPERPTWPNQ